ncbi:hypothetical protein PM082_020855 [Marasmius tenuissimus]|nr:hypothetical protein PM082_020855 [Marasmius tenuissimus]
MADFSATDMLGYSMNMIGTTPLDTKSARAAVQTSRRIINFDVYDTRPVDVDGTTYNIPKSISVLNDQNVTNGFVHYSTGNEAAISFRNDSTLATRFMSVTGDPSVELATEKHHRRNLQYAYYSFAKSKYLATLRDYAGLLNERSIKKGLEGLPAAFDGQNQDILGKYKSFFERFGTHVVTKVVYGAHYQLHLWAPTTDPSVNSKWAGNVRADYNGIPTSGEYDPGVRGSAQYQAYLNLKQRIESVFGGDRNKAQPLAMAPTWPNFQAWASTSQQSPALLSFVVDELWSLMRNAEDEDVVNAAPKIEEAFNFIVNNPKIYKTRVTLTIESDWAEFGLLTPSAIVIKGETVPPMTVWNQTKLTWGKEYSHQYHRETVMFYVVNDGYPIDFYISHGSDGGAPRQGKALVLIESESYENKDITENVWNTKWFYQAPVSSTPESFRSVPAPKPNSGVSAWDSVLEQYLNKDGGEAKKRR